jgi:hypothetical protein
VRGRLLITPSLALLLVLLACQRPQPPRPPSGSSVSIAAAGDIACGPGNASYNAGKGTEDACRQKATSDLLMRLSGLDAVLALGDTQYCCGAPDAFKESYEPTWGRLKDITYPVAGNHEYDTPGAAGYFEYFGDRAGKREEGYYSFDLGSWHFVALNSECQEVKGCRVDSPQGRWLKADLMAHRTTCTLAFWHSPMVSSGPHGNDQSYRDFWQILYDAGADVILNAHDHIYERFAPQDPQGALDRSRGIRQFTVGTGGGNHYRIVSAQPNSEVRDSTAFGILRMTLRAASYDWEFLPAPPEAFTDSGTGVCH